MKTSKEGTERDEEWRCWSTWL